MRSTVSDTWSTDVLASDSEPPEQNQLERLEEVAEEMARQNLLGVQEVSQGQKFIVRVVSGQPDTLIKEIFSSFSLGV